MAKPNAIEPTPEKFHTIMIAENPLHDAARGTEYVPVSMRGSKQQWDDCPTCGGKDKAVAGCQSCKGIGKVPVFETCLSCEGEGKKKTDRGLHRCTNCNGEGVTPVQINVEASIMIPRGTVAYNVPEWAVKILKNAIETHYNFVKATPTAKETNMVGHRRPSYPLSVLETYDKPLTDREVKNRETT